MLLLLAFRKPISNHILNHSITILNLSAGNMCLLDFRRPLSRPFAPDMKRPAAPGGGLHLCVGLVDEAVLGQARDPDSV